ncbi:MAG TPA: hypothetical protein VJ464_21825 [Blastocatellia bacterium]|nr:hypothetical protein [Blastocatellia bacterium]
MLQSPARARNFPGTFGSPASKRNGNRLKASGLSLPALAVGGLGSPVTIGVAAARWLAIVVVIGKQALTVKAIIAATVQARQAVDRLAGRPGKLPVALITYS